MLAFAAAVSDVSRAASPWERHRLVLALALAISTTSAHGGSPLDERTCSGKRSVFERTICADRIARAEDARMSTTYFETLHRLDVARRSELLADQRRWLKQQLADAFQEDSEMYTPVDNVVSALSQRTSRIVARFPVEGFDGAPDLLHAEGRHPPVFDPNKPFEGTYPGFVRWRGSEQEMPEMYFQLGDRVCGIRSEWFSGHVATIGIIAIANAERAAVRYTCKMDDTGERCATGEHGELLWLRASKATMKRCGRGVESDNGASCATASVPQLGFSDEDIAGRPAWITACLRDASFPPRDSIRVND